MKLSDKVLMRVVQVVQEAMLLGVDCVDIMRQIDVVPNADDANILELSEAYVEMVQKQHEKLSSDVETLKLLKTNKYVGDA